MKASDEMPKKPNTDTNTRKIRLTATAACWEMFLVVGVLPKEKRREMNGATESKFMHGDEGFTATTEWPIFLCFAINGASVLSLISHIVLSPIAVEGGRESNGGEEVVGGFG